MPGIPDKLPPVICQCELERIFKNKDYQDRSIEGVEDELTIRRDLNEIRNE